MNHTSCQFRDKHTVGGIVFYKHEFLVLINGRCESILFEMRHEKTRLWVNSIHTVNRDLSWCMQHQKSFLRTDAETDWNLCWGLMSLCFFGLHINSAIELAWRNNAFPYMTSYAWSSYDAACNTYHLGSKISVFIGSDHS